MRRQKLAHITQYYHNENELNLPEMTSLKGQLRHQQNVTFTTLAEQCSCSNTSFMQNQNDLLLSALAWKKVNDYFNSDNIIGILIA